MRARSVVEDPDAVERICRGHRLGLVDSLVDALLLQAAERVFLKGLVPVVVVMLPTRGRLIDLKRVPIEAGEVHFKHALLSPAALAPYIL